MNLYNYIISKIEKNLMDKIRSRIKNRRCILKISNKKKLFMIGWLFCITLFTGCSKTHNTDELRSTKMNTEDKGNSMKESETNEIDKKSKDSALLKNNEMISKEQAISIAQHDLSEDLKSSITNYDAAKVAEITFSEEPNIYKYEDTGKMTGNVFYVVTFHTKDEELTGPIVYYIAKNSGIIYGVNWQE